MQTEQYRWSGGAGWEPGLVPGTLGASAQIVLLFFDSDLAHTSEWYDAARRAWPNAHLLGCTSSGQIQGGAVRESSVVITAAAFAHTRVKAVSARIDGPDAGFEAGRQLAQSLEPERLAAVFLIADGLRLNATDTVDGLSSALPAGVCLFGGCASNGHNLSGARILCDGPPQDGIIAALGFYGDRLKVSTGSSAGWDQFGLDRLVTRSRKNVLYELDGRPALPLYKKYMGPAAAGLPASGMLFPLNLRIGDSTRGVLRGLLSVNEEEQSITFAGNVPEGAHARLMFGSTEHLIDGSIAAAEQACQGLRPHSPELLVAVSCAARQLVLKQRAAEELECFDEIFVPRPPVAGFYALGEVSPLEPGGAAGFHNETLTVAALAEV